MKNNSAPNGGEGRGKTLFLDNECSKFCLFYLTKGEEKEKKFRGETKSEPKLKRERRKKGYLSDQKITGERF